MIHDSWKGDNMMGLSKVAVIAMFLSATIGMSQPGGVECHPDAVATYDYAKCIESCDNQYSACVKRGAEVQYCSDQHDRCRKACLEHE